MRIREFVSAMVLGTLALSATIWLARYSPWSEQRERAIKDREEVAWQRRKQDLQKYIDDCAERAKREQSQWTQDHSRPRIADKPPFPKLELRRTKFNFGKLHVDEKLTCDFLIRNVGQGLLVIQFLPHCKNPTTKVTRYELKPGESTNIEVNFTPRQLSQYFAQVIDFRTNDPNWPEVSVKAYGEVVAARR